MGLSESWDMAHPGAGAGEAFRAEPEEAAGRAPAAPP